MAERFDVHATQIAQWNAELLERADKVLAPASDKREQASDVKAVYAEIGKQTLEIDSLSGALVRLAEPSANLDSVEHVLNCPRDHAMFPPNHVMPEAV